MRRTALTHYYWKRTPSGLADTEGGLYLKPRDLAKIGYLFLKNGEWEGKQIVQPDCCRITTWCWCSPAGTSWTENRSAIE